MLKLSVGMTGLMLISRIKEVDNLMRIIGLTGGVGCGKSTVADILKEKYNAKILLTDDLAKASYKKGEKGYIRIKEHFGESVLNCDGYIDREKLATLVFNDEEKLNDLNNLIHPIVWEMVMDEIRMAKEKGYEYLVIESAILVEAGYKKVCDEIWLVRSRKDIRIKRLFDTRGYSVEKSESIISNQAKEDVFIKNCDIIIDNDENIDKLECAIDRIINSRRK